MEDRYTRTEADAGRFERSYGPVYGSVTGGPEPPVEQRWVGCPQMDERGECDHGDEVEHWQDEEGFWWYDVTTEDGFDGESS